MHATTAATAVSAQAPGLLRNRAFLLLWGGQAVSNLGDIVFDTTLVLWIATALAHGTRWAPLAVSGVLLAATLPQLLVGPLAGVFVDRWDRRRTMLAMDLLRTLLIGMLVAAAATLRFGGGAGLGTIYGVVLLAGVCAQFFGPARLALLGDLVPERDRPQAYGLSQATGSLSVIAGPPLAALLFFGAGPTWALLANALSFLASFLAVAAIRAPEAPAGHDEARAVGFWKELGQGLRFFAGNAVLKALLVSVVLVMLGGGALNALDIFFLTDNLHAPASLYGLLSGTFGIGALCGALLGVLFVRRLGLVRTLWLGLSAAGLLILCYARLTSFGPALAVLALAGVASAAVNMAVGPLVLRTTPRELVGRVSAILHPAISLASLLSMALAGILASGPLRDFHARLLGFRWGAIDTVFTATGLLIVAGGLYAAATMGRAPVDG